MMVAISLFVVVALVVTTALLNLSAVNRENAAVKLALENMGLVFDTIRPAVWYMATAPTSSACNDTVGSISFAYFLNGDRTQSSQQFNMALDPASHQIKYTDNAGVPLVITTPDITITKLSFCVVGSSYRLVRVSIVGTVPVRGGVRTLYLQSTFSSIQTTP